MLRAAAAQEIQHEVGVNARCLLRLTSLMTYKHVVREAHDAQLQKQQVDVFHAMTVNTCLATA